MNANNCSWSMGTSLCLLNPSQVLPPISRDSEWYWSNPLACIYFKLSFNKITASILHSKYLQWSGGKYVLQILEETMMFLKCSINPINTIFCTNQLWNSINTVQKTVFNFNHFSRSYRRSRLSLLNLSQIQQQSLQAPIDESDSKFEHIYIMA